MKIYGVGQSLADWEKFPRRLIVLRLQNDEKGTVLARHSTLFSSGTPAYIRATCRVILIKIVQFRHQLPGADGIISRVERDRHVPGARVARAGAAGIEDGVRNSVAQDQSAKRVAHQNAMVDLLARLSRSQCQFVNGSKAAVLRCHRPASQLAVPKSQQIQARHAKVFSAPRDINADYVNLSLSHLGKTRDHINKVLKSADVP